METTMRLIAEQLWPLKLYWDSMRSHAQSRDFMSRNISPSAWYGDNVLTINDATSCGHLYNLSRSATIADVIALRSVYRYQSRLLPSIQTRLPFRCSSHRYLLARFYSRMPRLISLSAVIESTRTALTPGRAARRFFARAR